MARTTPAQFMRQVRQETAKIIWPTRRETIATTITVFALVTFASIFLSFVDFIIGWSVRQILGLGG
jgi:preprotein translocase subunit SecE